MIWHSREWSLTGIFSSSASCRNSARFSKTHPCWRPLIRLCCRTAWYGERATHTVRTRGRPKTSTHSFIFSPTENPAVSLLLRLPSARRPSGVQDGTGLYWGRWAGVGGGATLQTLNSQFRIRQRDTVQLDGGEVSCSGCRAHIKSLLFVC